MDALGAFLLAILLVLCAISTLLFSIYVILCRIKFQKRREGPTVVAFFHPYCSSGGGGERALWKAIQVLGDLYDKGLSLEIVIYTVDPPKESYKEGVYLNVPCMRCVSSGLTLLICCVPLDLLRHVQSRFSITPSEALPLKFVHLHEYAHFLGKMISMSLMMNVVVFALTLVELSGRPLQSIFSSNGVIWYNAIGI
jgi:hypothetical protein